MNKPKINYKLKVVENVNNFLKSNDPKDIVANYLDKYDIVLNIVQNDKTAQKYKELQSRKNEKDCSKFEKAIADDAFKKYLYNVLTDKRELLLKIFNILNDWDIGGEVYQLINLVNTNLDGSVFINGEQKFYNGASEILDDVENRVLHQYNDEISILISVDSRFIDGVFI